MTGKNPGKTALKYFKRGNKRGNLWVDQGGLCYLCGEAMLRRFGDHPRAATLDHVIPRSRGGRGLENLRLSHLECNAEKGSLTYDEYKAVLVHRQQALSKD